MTFKVARSPAERTPRRTMGGWPGALMAQNDLRHKTRKSLYQLIFRAIIALHLLAWAFYFVWTFHRAEL